MPTCDRRLFVPRAIQYFLRQEYEPRELVIIDDGSTPIDDLVPTDERIRYIRLERRVVLGEKRNVACEAARGQLIVHWDDDDWMAPWRLDYQVRGLTDSKADLCGLDRILFFDPSRRSAWLYRYPSRQRPWVAGNTMCYRRELWESRPFAKVNVGEDNRFVRGLNARRVLALPDPDFFVAIVHSGNTSPKRTRSNRWQPEPLTRIQALLGDDWSSYMNDDGAPAGTNPNSKCCSKQLAEDAVPLDEQQRQPCCLDRSLKRELMRSIAIGVHVHAEPERFRRTISALRACTPLRFELFLLPDGPDDQTRGVLSELHDAPRLSTNEPHGPAACFNRLAAVSDADVLVLLESGSVVGPGWLEYLLAALDADARNGLAGPSTNRAWNEQRAFRSGGPETHQIAHTARAAAGRFRGAWRTLEPLYSLADFCCVVRREVIETIGPADEAYGLGPCWEMDYNIRAARAGFRGVWACSAYVYRHPATARRQREEADCFAASKRRYQDKFCALRLRGERTDYEPHCLGDDCEHFAPTQLIQIRLPTSKNATRVTTTAVRTRSDDPPSDCSRFRETGDSSDLPVSANPVALRTPMARGDSGTDTSVPLVTCVMPTGNRADYALQAVFYFRRQSYANLELIILDDGTDDLECRLPDDPRIRYERTTPGESIGAKRNRACELARGEIIAQWDDDDWYAADRLSIQVAPLVEDKADITAFFETVFFNLPDWSFWQCTPQLHARLFAENVHGGTLVFRRSVWGRLARYPNRSLAEDAAFLRQSVRRGARLQPLPNPGQFIYLRHQQNSWSFECGRAIDPRQWHRLAEPALPAEDRAFYHVQRQQILTLQ